MKTILAIEARCLAYGGNPSADLSVQVVPSGKAGTCGVIMGQAATDAATAGFTACALYNDFATAIPNGVGTGLPSNWLNCTPGTDTGAVWNLAAQGPACGPGYFQQVTDTGVTPNALALDLHYNVATMTNGCIYCDFAELITAPWGTTISNPNAHSWSNGYFEMTYRLDTSAKFTGSQQAWWSYWCCFTSTTFVEMDFMEDWGTAGGGMDSAYDYYTNNIGTGFGNVPPGYPSHDATTAYHTVGALVTGNLTNFSLCNYYHGAAVGCTTQPYSSGQDGTQRRQLWMENGVSCNDTPGDTTCVPGSFTDSHMYVKSVKAIVCSAELSGGSCLGNSYNGSFYQP